MITYPQQIIDALKDDVVTLIPKVEIWDIDAMDGAQILDTNEYAYGTITGNTLVITGAIVKLNESLHNTWGEWISRDIDLLDETNNIGNGAIINISAIETYGRVKISIKTASSQALLSSAKWGGADVDGNWYADGYYMNGATIKLDPTNKYHRWAKIKITLEGALLDTTLTDESGVDLLCETGDTLDGDLVWFTPSIDPDAVIQDQELLDETSDVMLTEDEQIILADNAGRYGSGWVITYAKGFGRTGFIDISDRLCGMLNVDGDIRNFVSSQTTMQLSNTDKTFSFGGLYYPLLTKGNEVRVSMGVKIKGVPLNDGVSYYPFFYGRIAETPNSDAIVNIQVLDLNSKLTELPTPTGIFGSVYCWRAMRDIYEGLGFVNFDFSTASTTTLPASRYFQSTTKADVAMQKLIEVINYRIWSTADGYIKLAPRNTGATVDHEIDDTELLYNGLSIKPNENLIMRMTAVNSEDSLEEVADGQIGSASGTLSAGTANSTITINFTSAPITKIYWENSGTAYAEEVTRTAGYAGSNGSIQIKVSNINYPRASSTYNLTVYGRVISTADASIKFSEKISQDLWTNQKGQDITLANRFLLGQTEVDNAVTAQMAMYGSVLNWYECQAIFLPFVEFNDCIRVNSTSENIYNKFVIMQFNHQVNIETGVGTSKVCGLEII